MTLLPASAMKGLELPPLKKEGRGGFAFAFAIKSNFPLTPLFQGGKRHALATLSRQWMLGQTDA